MIAALIPWFGIASVLGIMCKTIFECVKLYYQNQDKIRLERFDRQLQMDARLVNVDQESVLGKIVDLVDTRLYPYQIGEGVIAELKQNNLITEKRANYVMVGADSHRGRNT